MNNKMKKNKILSNLRIESDLFEKMLRALEELNSNNVIELDITNFRRMAYKYFTEKILVGDFEMNLVVKK